MGDVLTDVNYVVTTRFLNMGLFIATMGAMMISSVLFLLKLLVSSRGRGRQVPRLLPNMVKVPISWMFTNTNVIWLRSVNGMPGELVNEEEAAVPFKMGSSSFADRVMWVYYILSQLVWFAFYTAYLSTFGLCYLLGVFFIGLWSFQNKTMASRRVWNSWAYLWTGSDVKFRKDVGIDVELINESMMAEFIGETLPQLVLQMLNNSATGTWTVFGYISLVLSLTVAVNGAYRLLYYRFWRGYAMDEIPADFSVFGFFQVKLSAQKELVIMGAGTDHAKIPVDPKVVDEMRESVWKRILVSNKSLRAYMLLKDMGINSSDKLHLYGENLEEEEQEEKDKLKHEKHLKKEEDAKYTVAENVGRSTGMLVENVRSVFSGQKSNKCKWRCKICQK